MSDPGRLMSLAAKGALAAVLAALAGCRMYECGSVAHPQLKTIAIGSFSNSTDEPRLGAILRQGLAERFMTDGSLTLVSADAADAVVTGRIRQCRMSRLAAAKRRDDAARDRDSDAYQSAIFRVEVVVEFQTVKPGREKPLIAARQARGVADFSHLPDMNAAKQEALRLAVNDVASEMVAAVAEAW